MHRCTWILRRGLICVFLFLAIFGYQFAIPKVVHAIWNSSINWNDIQQPIDGFGISEAFKQAQNLIIPLLSSREPGMEKVHDASELRESGA